MPARALSFIARGGADAISLYLVPCFTALLPWPIGFRLLRLLARNPRLYREATQVAWAAAQLYGTDVDEATWKRRFRLVRLVDHTDSYLTLLRGNRWWRRYVDCEGALPVSGAGHVLLTFHWGAGNWIWHILRAHGIHAHFLARRPEGRALGLTRLSHWYGAFRKRAMRRNGSLGVLFTGGSADAVSEALKRGESVVGMLDLPVAEQQQAIEAPLLDGRIRLPFGLVRLAVRMGAPIAFFSFGLDYDSGRRTLRWEQVPAALDAEEILQRYTAHLERCLRRAPEAWHMWREAPAMLVPAQTQGVQ